MDKDMLISFSIENFLSFSGRQTISFVASDSHSGDISESQISDDAGIPGLRLLKFGAVYGANASGKSNLVKSIGTFLKFIKRELSAEQVLLQANKTNGHAGHVGFEAEFVHNRHVFKYEIKITDSFAIHETLSAMNQSATGFYTVFARRNGEKDTQKAVLESAFLSGNEKLKIVKQALEENLINPFQCALPVLSSTCGSEWEDVRTALDWLIFGIEVVETTSYPRQLVSFLDVNGNQNLASEFIQKYDTGVENVRVESVGINELQEISDVQRAQMVVQIQQSKDKCIYLQPNLGWGGRIVVMENGELVVKELKFSHIGTNDSGIPFSFAEESDGTVSLLRLYPAFFSLSREGKTYVIDEMDRALHPNVFSSLVKNMTASNTLGQCLWTAHDVSVQQYLREDEIWFVEKRRGVSSLFSLFDFKKHAVSGRQIPEQYLSGRYGAVPYIKQGGV